MNKDDVLTYLCRLLGSICYVEDMLQELLKLIAGSGSEVSVFALLIKQLHILAEEGTQAVQFKEFENIGNGIYSMHLTGKGFNIRILYGFLPNREPVLLAFHERAGKKKTDYTGYLAPAKTRLESKKEEYNREIEN
jgi:hypothetical protein